MNLTTDIDRIEEALHEAYNNPGTAERVFTQKGLNEFRVMRYLETRGILTAAGAWIGPEPTRTLAGWVREECGALKPVKAKRTVQARVESGPVETITVKAKPVRKKRETAIPWLGFTGFGQNDTSPIPEVIEDTVKAPMRESNVYATLKEWYAKHGREEEQNQ